MRSKDVLSGVRVLDLTRLLPGAYCTLLLADMGADVIKIEEPGEGDGLRHLGPQLGGQSVLFNALNRNKRSVTLNLKAADGRSLLLRLVARSQVLVEGNRPGVMERLGLGWDRLCQERPGLVMCSITGYGQTGPLARRAGHDINYMALAGALSLTGVRGGAPLPSGLQVADLAGGGMAAACAILAGLLEVARGGPGRHLDIAMAEGAASLASPHLAHADAIGARPRRARQMLSGRYPCYRVYACADGYLSVGALEPKFWSQLMGVIGRPDLVSHQFAEGADGERAHAELEAVFQARSREEWERLFKDKDVCVEPVLEADEVTEHPQARARGLFRRGAGGLEVAPPIRTGGQWRRLEPPHLGEHNAELLAEVGIDTGRLDDLRRRGIV